MIPAALWDICGGVPMLSPVMPRAARTLLRSTQNLSGCKRPCGRNTRSPPTADAALLLAKMKDADLAPLEAAAEDAGVDPAHYYTTHTLCDAFLAKCDRARMQSFAPLFEGSADAARAALAALLPNTFLQALMRRTTTTPEAELLPEVTEHESV